MRVRKQHLGFGFVGVMLCFGPALSDGNYVQAQSLKQPKISDEGAGIVPAKSVRDKREKPAPAMEDKAETKPVTINPFGKQTDELWRCRYQVAAATRRSPDKVQAGRMLLRFTVDTNGIPVNTNVVALEAADPDVLVCVKQEINRWRLLPVPSQPLPIEVEVSLAIPQRPQDIAKR